MPRHGLSPDQVVGPPPTSPTRRASTAVTPVRAGPPARRARPEPLRPRRRHRGPAHPGGAARPRGDGRRGRGRRRRPGARGRPPRARRQLPRLCPGPPREVRRRPAAALAAETAAASAGPRHAELARAVLRGYAVPEADEVHAVRVIGSPACTAGSGSRPTAASTTARPTAAAGWVRALDALHALLTHWPAAGPDGGPMTLADDTPRPAAARRGRARADRPRRAAAAPAARVGPGAVPRPPAADGRGPAGRGAARPAHRGARAGAGHHPHQAGVRRHAPPRRRLRPARRRGPVRAGERRRRGRAHAGPDSPARRPAAAPAPRRFDLPEGTKDVEVWLPHDETTELVALRADAAGRAAAPPRAHAGCTTAARSATARTPTHPTGTWPVVAAGLAGLDLVNLGLGGSALLDPFTARALRDLPADVVSLEIGINVVNLDVFRRRRLRAGAARLPGHHPRGPPDEPLLVSTSILCPMQEDTPGPVEVDPASFTTGQLRFRATGDPAESRPAAHPRASSARRSPGWSRSGSRRPAPAPARRPGALRRGRPRRAPLPDGLHPDGETHRLIGERFARLAFGPGGPLDS